jgi:hypothetical protein
VELDGRSLVRPLVGESHEHARLVEGDVHGPMMKRIHRLGQNFHLSR